MVNEEQVDTITLVLKFTMLFDFRFLQNFSRNGILISGAWENWWNERSKPRFENGKFFLASLFVKQRDNFGKNCRSIHYGCCSKNSNRAYCVYNCVCWTYLSFKLIRSVYIRRRKEKKKEKRKRRRGAFIKRNESSLIQQNKGTN